MRKVCEVLRLKWEARLSHRSIARSCGISHGTVREYLHRARQTGMRWPLPEGLGEDRLYKLRFPKPAPPSQRAIPEPDWKYNHTELKRRGVTRRLLWLEYRETHPDGYGYSRFCELYRRWAGKLDPPTRLTHKGGEKLFVDYAGQIMPVVDPQTGEIREAHIFTAVLAASRYAYAEADWAEDRPNCLSWPGQGIGGHVRALAFFGGAPEIITPDNPTMDQLRAVVDRCAYGKE